MKERNRVVVVDDLIATGCTTKAICELVEELGAEIVSLNFFIELEALKGREVLEGYRVESIIQY